jgi:hypothetical protein
MRYALVLLMFATAAHAGSGMLETTDEARQRHNAERYQQYKENGYQAPLGGYRERLGDPAPYGTERPGYVPQGGYQSNQPYESWQDRLKR